MPPAVIAAAERRAQEIGLGAEQALIAAGVLSEDAYLKTLASSLGLRFDPLDAVPRHACPLDDERFIEAATIGLLPLRRGGALTLVVAPRGIAARRLCDLARRAPDLRERIELTSLERLQRFAIRNGADAIGRRAAHSLRAQSPEFSAGTINSRTALFAMALIVVLSSGVVAGPQIFGITGAVSLAALFLAWMVLRVFGALSGLRARDDALPRLSAERLPVYSIIVALYREATAARGLITALNRLNYPPEKLDIKLVLEADDKETQAALAALKLGPPYQVLIAPAVGPRTKPKALNAALQLVRGTFTAVFDAEDRPEPDQLRQAVGMFYSQGPNLACVQARLTIDNTEDNWLTRLFTAEYAGLFDAFLPGLAAHQLPLPLGGSSNHFRTAVLREVGGWDPYNVTEDADLGIRLARFGYRTDVISSSTFEEAPAQIGAWLRQRTRWCKGWLQTWLVHMRAPAMVLEELGLAGFLTFQLVVGGTVLAALVHPLFLGVFLCGLLTGSQPLEPQGSGSTALTALYGGVFCAGYLTSAASGLIGLSRRRLMSQSWVLILVPLHWMLLSLAAWRALFQLVSAPYRWEKTDHGLARTSRWHRGAAVAA